MTSATTAAHSRSLMPAQCCVGAPAQPAMRCADLNSYFLKESSTHA